MLKGSTRLCANFARSFAGKQTRAASDAKQSSRGRLPYFYPASVPKQGNLSAKEYAEKLHQARLAALQATLPDRCEFRNKGAPTVKAFYLTDSPFRISHFPPGIFGKFSRRLERLGVMYTTQRLFLINPIATDQFSRAALITALHNTTTTILPKIRQNQGKELVEKGLITKSALKPIEEGFNKLSVAQRSLLNIKLSDFVLPKPHLYRMNFRSDDSGKRFIDYYFMDVAFFAADKLQYDKSNLKLIINKDYPFNAPKQVYLNVVLSREIIPNVGKYFVSQLNVIVMP